MLNFDSIYTGIITSSLANRGRTTSDSHTAIITNSTCITNVIIAKDEPAIPVSRLYYKHTLSPIVSKCPLRPLFSSHSC